MKAMNIFAPNIIKLKIFARNGNSIAAEILQNKDYSISN